MTPEEKSKELIDKFSKVNDWIGGEGFISIGANAGKKCAIICAEQIIEWERLNFGTDTRASNLWKEVIEHIKNS